MREVVAEATPVPMGEAMKMPLMSVDEANPADASRTAREEVRRTEKHPVGRPGARAKLRPVPRSYAHFHPAT